MGRARIPDPKALGDSWMRRSIFFFFFTRPGLGLGCPKLSFLLHQEPKTVFWLYPLQLEKLY
ncbi:hypothetical protein BDV10DRAFT_86618 [Aspergillus recurvatus]